MPSSELPKVVDHDYEIYNLGTFALQSGQEIPDAFIAYKTLGDPSLPAIIYPTWYSGLISDNLWLIGPEKTLNPQTYYIIIPALFGNSQSSSPSNTPSLHPFPTITFYDNIRAQHRLITQHLGITHARAILGWSMAAAQCYQWATQHPTFADLIVPFCGSARTSPHNKVMLEGVKAALHAAAGTSSAGIGAPQTADQTVPPARREAALKALARVYAGWGFSQAFYRDRVYEQLGFSSLDAVLSGFWEPWALAKDPADMLCMAQTWQLGDCSAQPPYFGDWVAAMRAIRARVLVVPSASDLYFPKEDSELEVRCMREGVARLRVFESVWGHWAGGPGQSVRDGQWLDERLREFFAEE